MNKAKKKLPESLENYEGQAQKWIEEGCVREIQFSGPTYQVQIHDLEKKRDFWTFLHLNSKGQISDSFCSCEESEEEVTALHLAISFLRVYCGTLRPLHERFPSTLWNKLCRHLAEKDSGDLLKQVETGHYVCYGEEGEQFFSLQARTLPVVQRVRELVELRPEETEDTSIKFSNLSEEELQQWREGNPSSDLLYELSLWSDLAKWLLFLQESGETPTFTFSYEEQLPSALAISFSSVELFFALPKDLLLQIIPTLAQQPTPLAVHSVEEESVEKIVYDEKEKSLFVLPKKHVEKDSSVPEGKEVISLEGWDYVPGYGFYAKDQHYLLSLETVREDAISKVLNDHFFTVKRHLVDVPLHADVVRPSYLLFFDEEWNLTIESYLFSRGDLLEESSALFGDWVYLPNKGFVHTEPLYFSEAKISVPSGEVAGFLRKERAWLNKQPGFQLHPEGMERQLTYELDVEGGLRFAFAEQETRVSMETKEFGGWLYVAGQGFYAKHSAKMALPFRISSSVPMEQVSLFIQGNREELKTIPGFFSSNRLLSKLGLIFSLEEDLSLSISPRCILAEDYEDSVHFFFDDFLYVGGEGFYEVPEGMRLPERYRTFVQIKPEKVAEFLQSEWKELIPFAIEIDSKLTAPRSCKLFVDRLERQEQHYVISLHYRSEIGSVDPVNLFFAVKDKKRFFFSDAGLIDLERRQFNWLRLIQEGQVNKEERTFSLTALELIRLNAIEKMQFTSPDSKKYSLSKELLSGLLEFRIPNKPDLRGILSELRAYQEVGLNWLWFLYTHQLSGLLCDDMGLGKTHQAMALMAASFNDRKPGEKKQFLVICPTSVICHWQEKLETYAPFLKIFTFYGSKRDLDEFSEGYDLLLTSYGIWRNEKDLLSKIPFDIAIFDEVQVAKNYSSLLHASLLMTRAKMRLGLTGTPIENRLRELKTLFDLVLPSYMPSHTEYRRFFLRPIEKEGNLERKELLGRFVGPFMLRRKKKDVLSDLPEKIEEVAHCELLASQRDLYHSVLTQARARLIEELHDTSQPVPYLHIFALLSALKQICNHPAAYLRKPQEYQQYVSGKWELFTELLNEARESDQKVVVFSQYLAMLDIIEEYLNDQSIAFAGIRGSTRDRKEQLQRFQNDPDCHVFVASLQATGLGVDLTAASVVIHYDRWWNAARENQATDRIHRIGQTRGVQVFKLVTKGTFEEKIDEMISKKGRLMEDVVGVDDQGTLKQFDRQEIMELLDYVEEGISED